MIPPSTQSFLVSLLLTTNDIAPMQTREGRMSCLILKASAKGDHFIKKKKKDKAYEEISSLYELLS